MENEIYKKEQFFHRCSFCKVFAASDVSPSGHMPHAHEFMQVWYVLRGQCEHHVGERIYCLDVGDSFLIPPNVIHRTVLQPASHVICCDFDPACVLASPLPEDSDTHLSMVKVMCFLEESRAELPRVRFQQNTRRRVERLMLEMLEEYGQGSFYFEEVLRMKIRELLLLFMREFASTPDQIRSDQIYEKYKALMAEAIRYIDENYCESLTLGDVCRQFAISKTYFCHLFKLMTGKTFTEYQTDLRIGAAMTMLEDHSRSIAEISEKLGFSNTSYFSRLFKKYTGCLPKEYRKERSMRRNSPTN